jgi:hypothetical protein
MNEYFVRDSTKCFYLLLDIQSIGMDFTELKPSVNLYTFHSECVKLFIGCSWMFILEWNDSLRNGPFTAVFIHIFFTDYQILK